jgi:hypothetical protein
MAIQTPPPQAPKQSNKAGWGCLGCGCVVVLVVLLLIAGLIGGTIYMIFKEAYVVSSATAETIAPFTASDDVYASAQKKVAAFNQDVSAGKSSTLTLTSDEVNALLDHSVDLKKFDAQFLITLSGDTGRVQGSVPSNKVPFLNWDVKDRYYNLDATTGLSFNADTKEVELQLKKLQLGDIIVPANSMESLQVSLSQQLNQALRKNAAVANVLDNAKTVSIKDGQFVIETK